MKLPKTTMMKKILGTVVLATPFLTTAVYAQKIKVTVQNLTHGSHFTPLLVAAHNSNSNLFKPGAPASVALQKMAEGGNTADLIAALDAVGAMHDSAAGLLAPGHSFTSTVINTDNTNNNLLSIVGMVLPTNDGFVGVSSWQIPTAAGTYMMPGLAYDAGTEANDELLGLDNAGAPGNSGAPGAPSGNGGSNGTGAATTDTNQMVHIHRGVLGDTDAEGGVSDFDSRVHRWLNPVARITVTVSE